MEVYVPSPLLPVTALLYEKKLGEILCRSDVRIMRTISLATYDAKADISHWRVYLNDGIVVAGFELYPMIGCCGIAVSTHAFVNPSYRRKGIGTVLNLMRQELAVADGFSILLCTDVVDNEAQQKILNATGWKRAFSFLNRRTGNTVSLHYVTLKEVR